MRSSVTLLLLLPFLLAGTVFAQPERSEVRQAEPFPTLDSSQLTLRYYRLQRPSTVPQTLFMAAQQLFGRRFRVADTPAGTPMTNLLLAGRSIAVLDDASRAERILSELPRLEEAAAPVEPEPQQENLATVYVHLDSISVSDALAALRPFERVIGPEVSPATPQRAGATTTNMSASRESNTLIIRDTPENIREIQQALAAMDRPRAEKSSQVSVTITAYVVRTDAKESSGELPKELVGNLRALVPYEHFQTLGTGVLRATSDQSRASLGMPLGQGFAATLQMNGIQYDRRQNTLQTGVSFQLIRSNSPDTSPFTLETRAQVDPGQYTVIGAFGEQPYFLVLRATVQ